MCFLGASSWIQSWAEALPTAAGDASGTAGLALIWGHCRALKRQTSGTTRLLVTRAYSDYVRAAKDNINTSISHSGSDAKYWGDALCLRGLMGAYRYLTIDCIQVRLTMFKPYMFYRLLQMRLEGTFRETHAKQVLLQ